MMEIVADKVFVAHDTQSTGPDILLVKRFQKQGQFTDKEQFHILEENINDQDDIHSFCRQQLAVELPRDDYWEILELTTIYLLATPSRSIRFMQPGKFSPSS